MKSFIKNTEIERQTKVKLTTWYDRPRIFIDTSGTMTDGGSRPKNWGLGDILGRSKDGFQPVNTEERDGLVGDDSDSEVS